MGRTSLLDISTQAGKNKAETNKAVMDTRPPTLPTPVYPTAQPFAPNSWDQRSNRRDIGFAIGAVVLIVAIVAACIAMVHGREALGPSEWDPRVVPLVAFVEEARGYTFAHPVYVEFLTAEQYRAYATERSPVSDQERERQYYRTSARFFRALGLIGGDVDLAAEQDEINDSGTLALYSPANRTVYVRGVEVTASLRLTLVHELTHALQDQIFNLNLSRTESDGEAFALRALAEGDAMRIENEYYATLSEDEQQQIEDQSQADQSSSKALNSDRAPILLALFGAPYALGGPFVRLLASIEGELDRAFRSPPTSQENVFDPASFLLDDQPEHVIPAKVPDGATYVADMGSEIGVVLWYLLIATHLDQKQALDAVDGWAGDAMTVYEKDDMLCSTLGFLGDTETDANEMYRTLTAVAAKLFLDHKPKVANEAREVQLTLCDPGVSAKPPTVDATTIFARPTVHSLLLGLSLDDPAVTTEQADCAVDKTIHPLADADMTKLLQAPSRQDPFLQEVLAHLKATIATCR